VNILYNTSLQVPERELPCCYRDICKSMSNLTATYSRLSRLDDALEMQQLALVACSDGSLRPRMFYSLEQEHIGPGVRACHRVLRCLNARGKN
jgi:hypothetical protein